MRLHLFVWTSAVTAAIALLAQSAAAQSRAGREFVEIFNVGGVDETLGINGGEQNGLSGAIGCGNGAPFDEGRLNDIVGSGNRDLFDFCNNLTSNTDWGDDIVAPVGNVTTMQEALAPTTSFIQTDQAAALATLQINNVSLRLTQLGLVRRGREDLGGYAFERGERAEPVLALSDPDGLQVFDSELQAGGFAAALQRGISSGDGLLGIEGLAAFANGQYTRLDQSNSSHEVGSDGNGGGFTLGIDKALGKSASLGLAFGYSFLDTDYNRGFGDSQLHDITFSTYGSVFFGEHVYVDGIVSGSILLFDQTRKVPTGVGGDFDGIDSDPEGWNVTGDVGLGGEFALKPFDLNPYLRVAVSQTEIDSYDENGSSLALDVDDQENTSVTLTPGLSVSLPVSTSFGVVSPYVRGEYVHEFGDQADDVRGNLSLIPDAGFDISPNGTDEDYGNVGGGVTATFAKGFSTFVDYNALVGFSDLLVQQVTLGGRVEF